MRELERNTPNIYLIYQTINIIMKKTPSISYNIPAQIQTIMGHCQGDRRLNLVTLLVTILQPQTQQMFSTGMHMEEENMLFSMDIHFLVKRPNQLKAGKPERDNKTISSE